DDYDGSFDRFWEDFRSRVPFSKPSDFPLLNDWCMAACYSTDEDGTVHVPYEPLTGELKPEVWERWLAWDPVRVVRRSADAPRALFLRRGYRVPMRRTVRVFRYGNGGNIARAHFCNRHAASLMLRIHADGSTNTSLHGFQTLYPARHTGWTDDIYARSLRAAR